MSLRISTRLLMLVFVASSLAMFGIPGIFVALYFLGAIFMTRRAVFNGGGWWALAAVVVIPLLVAFLLLAGTCQVRETARRVACMNNLHNIGIALYQYRQEHRLFVSDHMGSESQHPRSWRVAILPYIEEPELYREYDFNEPWDSPHNRGREKDRPYTYICPSDRENRNEGRIQTNYVAVIGRETPWGNPRWRLDKATPAHNPVVVIDVRNSGIDWMEPRDLTVDEVIENYAKGSGPTISSHHVRESSFFYHDELGSNVLFADRTVRFLPARLPPEMLRAILTGQMSPDQDLDRFCETYGRRVNWQHCLGLAAFVLSGLWLLVQPRAEPQVA